MKFSNRARGFHGRWSLLSGAIWVGRYAPWVDNGKTSDSVISRRTRTLHEMEDLRAGREPTDSVGIASDPTIDPPTTDRGKTSVPESGDRRTRLSVRHDGGP